LHLLRVVLLGMFFVSYFYLNYNLVWFLFIYAILDSIIYIFLGLFADIVIKNSILVNLYKSMLLIVLILLNIYTIIEV